MNLNNLGKAMLGWFALHVLALPVWGLFRLETNESLVASTFMALFVGFMGFLLLILTDKEEK